MSKKTTLESAYFHISNSGFSYRIVEKTDKRENCTNLPEDWFEGIRTGKYRTAGFADGKMTPPTHADGTPFPEVINYNRRWYFEVQLSSFGSGVTFRFPLIPLKVKWLIDALQRVLVRMEAPQTEPTDGVEFAFRDSRYCDVNVRDGQPVKESFPPGKPEPVSASWQSDDSSLPDDPKG